MFEFEDPTLDCVSPAPLFLEDYSTTKCGRNEI